MAKEKAGDAKFLKRQRERLIVMRDEIQNGESAKSKLDRSPRSEGAEEIEDDAQRLTQSEIDGAVQVVEQQRLNFIDRALAKIDEGTYGLSDESGDPIPKARLEAIPEAIFTIEEEEARERQRR
jgi:DnaK suppressor protein